MSNWLSWASVRAHTDMGQSDTSVVGFAQFAGCQMRLIVRPSAGHSFFSTVSGKQIHSLNLLYGRISGSPLSLLNITVINGSHVG